MGSYFINRGYSYNWCVCTWPSVRQVFQKCYVVVFQPRTVTPPHLCSAAIVTFKVSLLPHLFLTFVWIFLLPSPSFHPPIHSHSLSKFYLFCTSSSPPLPAQCATHLDITCTCDPPASASLHRSYLRLAPRSCV